MAGLDEAGRGAWAGPVSAGAVILPPVPEICRPAARGARFQADDPRRARILGGEYPSSSALAWGVGFASNQEIDELGIVPATRLAMARALAGLLPGADHLLIDALRLPEIALPQTPPDQRRLRAR